MEALWNKLDVNRPPTCSWTTSPESFEVSRFTKLINTICITLQSQELFHTEATILSRLVYRMKTKFRHDKGLKNMEKVNRGLCNYFHLALFKEYNNLKESIIFDDTNIIILPSRQMLQYVLVRTQAFVKLLRRVQESAYEAGKFLRTRIMIGQAWTVSMLAWSTISRIWVLSRSLVTKCCTWYNCMYPFLTKLKLVGVDWMPTTYTLPSNLNHWLSSPWVNDQIQCSLTSSQSSKSSIFNLIKMPDELISFEEEKSLNIENESNKEEYVLSREAKVTHVDVGIKISRESLDANLNTKKTKLKKKGKIKIKVKDIKTIEDLNLLLNYDSYPGLDKLQWNIVKKKIFKKLQELRKINDERKRKIRLKKLIQSIQAYAS